MNSGLYLKSSLAITALFVLLIHAIRAQPQDTEMRRFIQPPAGCPMPCWQGIRPSVTTADEAVAILEAHEWGGQIITRHYNADSGDGLISWIWNDHLTELGRFRGVRLRVRDHVVWNITLPPGVPLNDVWYAYGQPDSGNWAIMNVVNGSRYRIDHTARYQAASIMIFSRVECPAHLTDFWRARTTIQIGKPQEGYFIEPVVRVVQYQNGDLRELLHAQAIC